MKMGLFSPYFMENVWLPTLAAVVAGIIVVFFQRLLNPPKQCYLR